MSIKKDWAERQIELLSKGIVLEVFGKDKLYNIFDEYEGNMYEINIQDDILECVINKHLLHGKINKAEDLFWESIKEDKSFKKLITGLNFYNKLDKLSEKELEDNDFSKEEIKEGILELKTYFYQ